MSQDTLTVQLVAVAELFGSPGNPRLNEHAVPKVADSIRRFGWQQPIVKLLVAPAPLAFVTGFGSHGVPIPSGRSRPPTQPGCYLGSRTHAGDWCADHTPVVVAMRRAS